MPALLAFFEPGVRAQGDPSGGQDEKSEYVNCTTCNHKGGRECKSCKNRQETFRESGADFDSELAKCKTCEGSFVKDCPKCENPASELPQKKRIQELADWTAKQRARVDELVGHECMHAQSRWFFITFDLKPMMVGKIRLGTYELMHLYIKRMEEFRVRFKEAMEVSDADIPDRCELYMWRDGRDQALAAPKFTGMGASGAGVKLMGASSVYSMLFEKRFIKNDEDLHRHMVHNATHLLSSQLTPAQWIGKFGGGWLDAGLAHYFEFKLDEKCTTYCYQEVATQMNFKGGKWLVPIRKMVAGDRNLTSFPTLCTKNTDGLDPKEHALAFSYVHFLLEGDWESSKAKVEDGKGRGKALTQVLRILKQKKDTREALRDVYGWTGLSLEEKWKEWVLRTYPTR
ncbi:MAG: hypothetical protein KDC95_03865 [Planctomycetes bacterium]|nr:hypothetical protein [Planctomycetota bacterium]